MFDRYVYFRLFNRRDKTAYDITEVDAQPENNWIWLILNMVPKKSKKKKQHTYKGFDP